MNHFNFFNHYSESRGAKQLFSKKGLTMLGITFACLCVFIYGILSFMVIQRKAQLEFLNEIKTNKSFNSQYVATNEISGYIGRIEREIKFLQELNLYVDAANTGRSDLVQLIDRCTDGAFLTRITVTGKYITVEGNAENMDVITAIEQRFRDTNEFSAVLINTVSSQDDKADLFRFSCRLTLEGGTAQNEE